VQFTPDPFRGNRAENYAITLISGQGNASLQPERSKSLSLGMILTPFQGLRFSADYTRIKKDSEIGVIPAAYLLANPELFPGRVVREVAPLPGDPAGYLGRIISIDQTPLNFFRAIYQSVDFQLDYNIESEKLGKVRLYAIGTWHPDSIRQTTAAGTSLNYAGNRDGPLLWQGNGGFDWQLGDLNIQWNTQFYNSYNSYNTADPSTASGAATIASAISLQGARKVPAQSYTDLFVSYDFGNGGRVLNGLRLSAGIQNLFDKAPPVIAITSYRGTGYSTYGDPRLRRFTVSLRKSFGTK
jgi:iron complex outermembrane receptor protein